MIQPSYFRTISAAATPKSRCSRGRKRISPRCPTRGALRGWAAFDLRALRERTHEIGSPPTT